MKSLRSFVTVLVAIAALLLIGCSPHSARAADTGKTTVTPTIAMVTQPTQPSAALPVANQTTATPVITTNTDLNTAILSSGRFGVGAIGILGKNESGSFSQGLSFQKTDAVFTLDLLRYNLPIGNLKGEASFGVYTSTSNINLQKGSVGPQINYSVANVILGVAYVPTYGQNKGQFIVGHRF